MLFGKFFPAPSPPEEPSEGLVAAESPEAESAVAVSPEVGPSGSTIGSSNGVATSIGIELRNTT